MGCKAAIFDLDGTILDSMPIWCNLCGEFLKKHGIDENIDLDGKLGVISIARALEYVIREFKLDIDLDSACRQAWQIVGTFYREEVELKTGISAILDELKRKHIPAGIITASESGLVKDALKRVGLENYFEGGIISCADLQTSKRTPEVFFTMSDKLGAAPQETFVFEDAHFQDFFQVLFHLSQLNYDQNEVIFSRRHFVLLKKYGKQENNGYCKKFDSGNRLETCRSAY